MRITNSISELQDLGCHKLMRGTMMFAFFATNVVGVLLNLSFTNENVSYFIPKALRSKNYTLCIKFN